MANDKDIKLNVQADVSLNNLDEIEKLQKQIQSIAQTMLGLEKFNPIGANEEEIKKVFSLISERIASLDKQIKDMSSLDIELMDLKKARQMNEELEKLYKLERDINNIRNNRKPVENVKVSGNMPRAYSTNKTKVNGRDRKVSRKKERDRNAYNASNTDQLMEQEKLKEYKQAKKAGTVKKIESPAVQSTKGQSASEINSNKAIYNLTYKSTIDRIRRENESEREARLKAIKDSITPSASYGKKTSEALLEQVRTSVKAKNPYQEMFGGIKYQPKKESTLQHFALNMEEERLSSKPQFSNMPKLSYTPKKAPDIKEMDKGTPEGIQLGSKPVSSGRNAKKLYDKTYEIINQVNAQRAKQGQSSLSEKEMQNIFETLYYEKEMRDRVSEMDKTSPKEEGKAYFKRSSFGSFVGSKGEFVPSSYVDKETGYRTPIQSVKISDTKLRGYEGVAGVEKLDGQSLFGLNEAYEKMEAEILRIREETKDAPDEVKEKAKLAIKEIEGALIAIKNSVLEALSNTDLEDVKGLALNQITRKEFGYDASMGDVSGYSRKGGLYTVLQSALDSSPTDFEAQVFTDKDTGEIRTDQDAKSTENYDRFVRENQQKQEKKDNERDRKLENEENAQLQKRKTEITDMLSNEFASKLMSTLKEKGTDAAIEFVDDISGSIKDLYRGSIQDQQGASMLSDAGMGENGQMVYQFQKNDDYDKPTFYNEDLLDEESKRIQQVISDDGIVIENHKKALSKILDTILQLQANTDNFDEKMALGDIGSRVEQKLSKLETPQEKSIETNIEESFNRVANILTRAKVKDASIQAYVDNTGEYRKTAMINAFGERGSDEQRKNIDSYLVSREARKRYDEALQGDFSNIDKAIAAFFSVRDDEIEEVWRQIQQFANNPEAYQRFKAGLINQMTPNAKSINAGESTKIFSRVMPIPERMSEYGENLTPKERYLGGYGSGQFILGAYGAKNAEDGVIKINERIAKNDEAIMELVQEIDIAGEKAKAIGEISAKYGFKDTKSGRKVQWSSLKGKISDQEIADDKKRYNKLKKGFSTDEVEAVMAKTYRLENLKRERAYNEKNLSIVQDAAIRQQTLNAQLGGENKAQNFQNLSNLAEAIKAGRVSLTGKNAVPQERIQEMIDYELISQEEIDKLKGNIEESKVVVDKSLQNMGESIKQDSVDVKNDIETSQNNIEMEQPNYEDILDYNDFNNSPSSGNPPVPPSNNPPSPPVPPSDTSGPFTFNIDNANVNIQNGNPVNVENGNDIKVNGSIVANDNSFQQDNYMGGEAPLSREEYDKINENIPFGGADYDQYVRYRQEEQERVKREAIRARENDDRVIQARQQQRQPGFIPIMDSESASSLVTTLTESPNGDFNMLSQKDALNQYQTKLREQVKLLGESAKIQQEIEENQKRITQLSSLDNQTAKEELATLQNKQTILQAQLSDVDKAYEESKKSKEYSGVRQAMVEGKLDSWSIDKVSQMDANARRNAEEAILSGRNEARTRAQESSLNKQNSLVDSYLKKYQEIANIEDKIYELTQKSTVLEGDKKEENQAQLEIAQEQLAVAKRQIEVLDSDNNTIDNMSINPDAMSRLRTGITDINNAQELNRRSIDTRIQSMSNASDKKAEDKQVKEYESAYKKQLQYERDIARLRKNMEGQSGVQLKDSERQVEALQNQLTAISSITSGYDRQNGTLNGIKLSTEAIAQLNQFIDDAQMAQATALTQINTQYNKQQGLLASILGGFRNAFRNITDASLAYTIINKVKGVINDIITATKELDSALVDIQIATGQTRQQTRELLVEYADLADELGRTTQSVATASNDWLRAGYQGKEAAELTRASMMLSTLGMIDASEATTYLISTLKGWKIQADEVIDVVDKLTAVDIRKQCHFIVI